MEERKWKLLIFIQIYQYDIRTPLTSLDGYFQLLSESDDKEKNKRYITIIQREN